MVEKSEIDKIYEYNDKFYYLKQRKYLMLKQYQLKECVYQIVTHYIFEYLILMVILINSLQVLYQNQSSQDGNDSLEWFFMIVYTAEMFLKIIGMGFIFTKNAYLKDSMNILDISIVISAWIPVFFQNQDHNLQIFRIFRILRPFKTVKNIKALRQLV